MIWISSMGVSKYIFHAVKYHTAVKNNVEYYAVVNRKYLFPVSLGYSWHISLYKCEVHRVWFPRLWRNYHSRCSERPSLRVDAVKRKDVSLWCPWGPLSTTFSYASRAVEAAVVVMLCAAFRRKCICQQTRVFTGWVETSMLKKSYSYICSYKLTYIDIRVCVWGDRVWIKPKSIRGVREGIKEIFSLCLLIC